MRKWYPAVLIAAALIFTARVYNRLPESIPTHWGMNGEVNGWSSRPFGAFIMLGLALVMWGGMRGLPLIDPRRANYAKFPETYDLMVNGLVTFLVAAHVLILGAALGWPVHIDKVLPVGVGLLLMLMGNALPRARPNWWFGIRTPWTLSSDTVWTRTHRMGGYLMTAAGVVCVLSVMLPPAWQVSIFFVAIMGASLGSMAYSYVIWKQEQA